MIWVLRVLLSWFALVHVVCAQDFLDSRLFGGAGDSLVPLETNAPNSVPESLTDTISIEEYLKYRYIGQRVPVYQPDNNHFMGMVTNILFRDGRYYATIWNKKKSILETHINFVQLAGLPERLISPDATYRNRLLRQNIEVASFVNGAVIGGAGSTFESSQRAVRNESDVPRNKSVKRTRESDIIYFSERDKDEKTGFFWIAKGSLYVGDGYRVRIRFEDINE